MSANDEQPQPEAAARTLYVWDEQYDDEDVHPFTARTFAEERRRDIEAVIDEQLGRIAQDPEPRLQLRAEAEVEATRANRIRRVMRMLAQGPASLDDEDLDASPDPELTEVVMSAYETIRVFGSWHRVEADGHGDNVRTLVKGWAKQWLCVLHKAHPEVLVVVEGACVSFLDPDLTTLDSYGVDEPPAWFAASTEDHWEAIVHYMREAVLTCGAPNVIDPGRET